MLYKKSQSLKTHSVFCWLWKCGVCSRWSVFGHFWYPSPLSLTQKPMTMRSPEDAGHGWLMLVHSMPMRESILPFCLFASQSHSSYLPPHHTIWLLSIWWTSCDLTITIATSDRWCLISKWNEVKMTMAPPHLLQSLSKCLVAMW